MKSAHWPVLALVAFLASRAEAVSAEEAVPNSPAARAPASPVGMAGAGSAAETQNAAKCDSGAYRFYKNTSSAIPECAGTFASDWVGGPHAVKVAPVTGVASTVSGVPDRSHLVNTQNLIQARTSEGNEAQEYGQVINMWVSSGAGAYTDWNQKVGQFIGVAAAPGAGPVWGANIDVVQHEGVGDKELMSLEINHSNFNRDFPVGGTVSAALGILPLTSYRVTAGIYMAGTSARNASNPGGHMMYDAILVNGKNVASDNVLYESASSIFGLQLAGEHKGAGLYTGAGEMKYAVETKGGQKICLNFEDDCLFYAGANTSRLRQNGATVADFVSRDRAANNLALINAPAGSAPSVTSTGAEADIPLDLQAKGDSAVRILSKVTMAKLGGAGIVVADGAGHLFTVNETAASTSGPPSLSGCGEGASLDEHSTNRAGSFATGSNNPATCALIFNKTWKGAAFCTVAPANALAANL